MKKCLQAAAVVGASALPVEAQETPLSVIRGAETETSAGPEDYFTGSVIVGPLFSAPGEARLGGGLVQFEAGAYTALHTHPLGQTLYITKGIAWVQEEGGAIVEARPGDIVQIPAEVKHWHGAAAGSAMAHFAIAEAVDGSAVTWMEKVAPEDYAAGPAQ